MGHYTSAATASATIIDDENPPETVLFADSLDSESSSNNWNLKFMANNLIDDWTVVFGADLLAAGLAPAPNGATTALYLNVNKNDSTANGAAGVNLYAKNKSIGGSYALRFNMNLVQNDGAGTTEFAIFGINHSGNKTNWLVESGNLTANTPTDQDGLWYMLVGDASGSAPADYTLCTFGGVTNGPLALRTASAQTFANAFKKPPYSADGGAGSPANKTGNPLSIWSDVEVRQLGNVVRMQINKTTIFNYTNTTAFTNGDIMLGYCDPYASIGAPDGGVWISNLRVVAIGGPVITSAVKSGSNLNVAFRDDTCDPTANYRLLGSSVVNGTYTNMNAAITQTGLFTYTTSTSATNAVKFFRVQHLQ